MKPWTNMRLVDSKSVKVISLLATETLSVLPAVQ